MLILSRRVGESFLININDTEKELIIESVSFNRIKEDSYLFFNYDSQLYKVKYKNFEILNIEQSVFEVHYKELGGYGRFAENNRIAIGFNADRNIRIRRSEIELR